MRDESLTIEELSQRTGIPVRRIRFYVSRGLLPHPKGRGPAACYTREHLERLRQIQIWREQRLGLEEIRERLNVREFAVGDRAACWYHLEIRPGLVIMVREDIWPQEKKSVQSLVEILRRTVASGREGRQ